MVKRVKFINDVYIHKYMSDKYSMIDKYIGVDFGGTNLRMGYVNPLTGDIIGGVFKQNITEITTNEELLKMLLGFIPERNPSFGKFNIGISAAGDVDKENNIIRMSPNSSIKGEVTFGAELSKLKHINVHMSNDMDAAVQGESRYGEGKGLRSILVATYSSGYNCAVVRDGQNITTAEFGHMVYDHHSNLVCGCGGLGHLETFVSGNGAAQMAKEYFRKNFHKQHPILKLALEDFKRKNTDGHEYTSDNLFNFEFNRKIVSTINSKHVYDAFKKHPSVEPQSSIEQDQVVAIAISFGMMNSAYNPLDKMILMGSQAEKDWDTLIKPAIELYHSRILQIPTLPKPPIVLTKLPEIGVQGAVAYFISKEEAKR